LSVGSDNYSECQVPCQVPASARSRYAKCGDMDIAYQVLGEGPIDLLLLTGP